MSLDADIIASVAADYQYMDAVESLTYHRPNTGEEWGGVKGISESVKGVEIGGVLSLPRLDLLWIVFGPTLDTTPVQGDYLTDEDGAMWTVMEIRTKRLRTTAFNFVLGCVKRIEE